MPGPARAPSFEAAISCRDIAKGSNDVATAATGATGFADTAGFAAGAVVGGGLRFANAGRTFVGPPFIGSLPIGWVLAAFVTVVFRTLGPVGFAGAALDAGLAFLEITSAGAGETLRFFRASAVHQKESKQVSRIE